MDTITESPASDTAKACLRLVILTGTRSAEAREAKWAEIDGDTWHIPAERMKARRPHAVPLSDAALAILEGQRGQHDTYIFPSPRKTGPLGKMGMSRLADRLAGSVHGVVPFVVELRVANSRSPLRSHLCYATSATTPSGGASASRAPTRCCRSR